MGRHPKPFTLADSRDDRANSPANRGLYTRAEIDPCAAGDTESNAGRVRLLGYRVGAPNAGLPAGKSAYCQTRFLRCKKSRRVETRKSQSEHMWAAERSETDSPS
jgi:hypothetical protein